MGDKQIAGLRQVWYPQQAGLACLGGTVWTIKKGTKEDEWLPILHELQRQIGKKEEEAENLKRCMLAYFTESGDGPKTVHRVNSLL